MPRLIAALIRHGDYRQLPDTPSAHQPFPLTPEGRPRRAGSWHHAARNDRQSRLVAVAPGGQFAAAQGLADRADHHRASWPGVFASPPRLNGFDDLAERGLGSAANLSIAAIEAVVHEDPRFPDLPPDWKSNSRFRLPLQGAESLLEAGERVAAHIGRQMESLATNAAVRYPEAFRRPWRGISPRRLPHGRAVVRTDRATEHVPCPAGIPGVPVRRTGLAAYRR